MRLLMAPMEGLLDHSLRDTLTRVGGVDRCVSEFIRVTDTLLPARAFERVVPELCHQSRTPAGVPVRPQLLGSDPACMADNAARLAALGAEGVDLNFGCPAKTVNRHRGGAVLLDEPELVHAIVAAVRRAVPAPVPVSAKMRLGFLDDAKALDCALAIEAAGASELVVHARTRAQGYKPPADWDRLAEVRAAVALPVVANGEVWTVQDARRCLQVTGCDDLMLGRGLVADPGLALAIRSSMAPGANPQVPWTDIRDLLRHYWRQVALRVAPRHRAGRLKQWLHYLRRTYPQASRAFEVLRTVNDPQLLERWLDAPSDLPPGGNRAQPTEI